MQFTRCCANDVYFKPPNVSWIVRYVVYTLNCQIFFFLLFITALSVAGMISSYQGKFFTGS